MSAGPHHHAPVVAPVIVDKFGGSVLRRPEDIAAAVSVVAEQRAAGLRPVVVVSAFEGVTDTILESAAVLLPEGRAALSGPAHDPGSPLARETDRALATGEALSAALFALGLVGRGIPARSFSGAEAGIRTAAAHLGAEVRRVVPRRLRSVLAEGVVPVVAGFQGIGTHGELTTLGRGGTDLSAVVLAVALRADRCELFKDVGGVMEADPHLVPSARFLPVVDALQLELLAEMGAEVVHPVAVRRARRGRLRLMVRSTDGSQPQTEVRPGAPRGRSQPDALAGPMLAVARRERVARISLVGPAAVLPDLLPIPAHGAGSFDAGPLRVVWAEVPLEQLASAAQAVHAGVMLPLRR
ncbi:MAG TPA: aspartate kinase [candidate division Zixibacteria bacterium]|nr:aspartate kinase [candidate division Zixibacteria bacterium]